LEDWKNLQELRLDWNKVGKVGATEIARGLRGALNVTSVSMRGCYIGVVGAEAFGELVVGCEEVRMDKRDMNEESTATTNAKRPP
jgi:hypothetical protein